MEKNKKAKTIYFANLDGLRFFCFLSVFFFHSFHTEYNYIQDDGSYQLVKHELFGNGFLGVNFFFVLSGFLITYLLIQEKKLNGKINIPNFWLRRILRIWPLYFACVFFGFVIFPIIKQYLGGVSTETANPWYYMFFVSNFDYINHGLPDAQGLGVLWSVAIEEQFYLVWPIILFFFPVKRYWIPFTLIIVNSLVYRALNDVPILHEMHTFSCIGDMAIGAFGAWLILEKPDFLKWVNHFSRLQIVILYVLLAFILLFRDDFMLGNYVLRIFERMFISIVILFVILEQCYAEKSFFKMSKFRLPSKLGLITYGLYCIHFVVISFVVTIMFKLKLNNKVWEVIILEPAITLTITVIISSLSFKYFEMPFLKLKEKFGYFKK